MEEAAEDKFRAKCLDIFKRLSSENIKEIKHLLDIPASEAEDIESHVDLLCYMKRLDSLCKEKTEELAKRIETIGRHDLAKEIRNYAVDQAESETEPNTNEEAQIFYAICKQIRNWRRFGRLIGVEDYVLDNIELDNSNKYERLYECLKNKKEVSGCPIEWCFLKERILKFREGGNIVVALEKRFPALNDSMNEEKIEQEADKYMFIDIFDIISTSLQDWKRLAKILDIEHVSIEIEGNNKYKDHLQEKVYRCIDEKKSSTWFYWRNILIKMEEEDLVEDIEYLYPKLVDDERIKLNDVGHNAVNTFGIFAHHAGRTENLERLSVKSKESIKICVGAGKCKTFSVKKIQDFSTIQDDYFSKYRILENTKKYDFSNINQIEECQILKTQHEWLENNKDQGFAVKGYDANEHLQVFSDHVNTYPQNDSILTYSAKHNIILHINEATTTNIKKTMRENCRNIRPLQTANECLQDQPLIYVPILLHNKHIREVCDKVKCETCIDAGLVASVDTFKDLQLLEKWWKNLLHELKYIKQHLKMKTDMSNDFLRSIIGYKALATCSLPSYMTVLEQEIEEAQKLIMLTPEQQRIIYSKKKHKVIKGSFGSGKTIIAQQIIKLVANSMSNNELIYYLFHDTTSVYIHEMIKLAKQLNNNNIIACKMTDVVKDQITLSAVLNHLLEINPGKTVHVFVEEFCGEVLDDKEVDKIKVLLKNDEFKKSHIVLVAQSMESERCEIHEENRLPYEKYNYKKLIEDTSFELFTLTYLIRSSVNINKIIDIAIPILKKTVLKSVVPKFEGETKTNIPSYNMTPKMVKEEAFNKENVHTQPSTIVDIAVQPQIQMKVIEPNNVDQKLMDTDKMLGYWTRNKNSYRSKTHIESEFAFVGGRENLHNVQGTIPSIYYPFNKDLKSYIHQVYCISEALKTISSKDGLSNQVIICLNTDSMAILKDALQCSQLQWTDDFSLYSKDNIDILLTDYTYVRGCEFLNVILIYPNDENHLQHNVIDGINRCNLNLSIMVLLAGIRNPTFNKIFEQWINKKLVQVHDNDYLKNADKDILKKFEESNKHLQKKDNQEQILDISDLAVQLKLGMFTRKQNDNTTETTSDVEEASKDTSRSSNNDEVGTVEAPASLAVFQDIWKTCKEASRNHNRSLLMEALKRNNLDVNATYYILDNNIYIKDSLLHWAAMLNDVDVVKFLCSIDNIDVNTTNEYGGTPLMFAAINNKIDVVRVLMNMDNIDVHHTSVGGRTALEYATIKGYNEIVDLLNNSS